MYLGIDIGTTGTKAMLVDESGSIIRTEYYGYPTHREGEGIFEQDANDWWQALVSTVNRCIEDIENKEDIGALALSTQAGTLVLTDAECNPLGKAITWQDSRAKEIAERLNQEYEQDYFYLNTGWKLSGSYNFLNMLWLKEHRPDLFYKAQKFLSVNEFLNYKLTGSYFGDYVNSGITQLFDLQTCVYNGEALNILEIPENKLAKLLPSGTIIGGLTHDAAKELGLTTDTKVVLAGQDQYCSALGMGAIDDGDVAMSTGTAWVILAISSTPLFHIESYIAPGRHICPDLWGNMATLMTGGGAIEWCKQLVGDKGCSYDDINLLASKSVAGANGLMLLPFFQGATYPIWNSKLRATLFGLELRHSKGDMVRVVMEGVAMQLNLIFETVKSIGFKPRVLKTAGGAVKSLEWVQIIADVTNTPLQIFATADMACVGAALIAAKANGDFSTYTEGIQRWNLDYKFVFPNTENTTIYRELFEKYKKRTFMLDQMYKD